MINLSTLKHPGMLLILPLVLYLSKQVGCRYFAELANGCSTAGLHFALLYGLLYLSVLLTLILVPLISIVYIRVTIIMPISKFIYDDSSKLDSLLFGWFDRCWSYFKLK